MVTVYCSVLSSCPVPFATDSATVYGLVAVIAVLVLLLLLLTAVFMIVLKKLNAGE